MRPPEVAAVISAAGRSSRMGRPKALLEWRGLPLIAHQVRLLAGLGQVVVVLGHGADAIRPFVPVQGNLKVVEHPGYDAGRSSSLVAGFKALSGNPAGVLVVAVDQPLVPGVVERLLEARGDVAQPVFQGRRGHPVLFRGELLPELLAIDEAGEGLRAVVRRHSREEVSVEDGGIWVDLNEPADYAASTPPPVQG